MSVPVVTPEEFENFRSRVVRARSQFETLDRGARRRCGEECNLTPSRISNVLSAKYIDTEALDRIEMWLMVSVQDTTSELLVAAG